jgi:hypothetical protein
MVDLYLPPRTVIVRLFFEHLVLHVTCSASLFIWAKYTGLFGVGSVAFPFSKMNTTDDIGGRSLGLSCTHKSPSWMQSKASSGI